jgi:hypothetical protein
MMPSMRIRLFLQLVTLFRRDLGAAGAIQKIWHRTVCGEIYLLHTSCFKNGRAPDHGIA